MIGKRSPSLERALQPQGGTVTDAELAALGSWAKPRGDTTAWAAHVRELLAASPGRDLASAALEARLALGAGRERSTAQQNRPQEARGGSGRVDLAGRGSWASEGASSAGNRRASSPSDAAGAEMGKKPTKTADFAEGGALVSTRVGFCLAGRKNTILDTPLPATLTP